MVELEGTEPELCNPNAVKNCNIKSNFKIRISKNKMIRNTKSSTLSTKMVPKSLSTGIFSTLFSAVHLDISPALGINIFVKYPTETAETELIFDDL